MFNILSRQEKFILVARVIESSAGRAVEWVNVKPMFVFPKAILILNDTIRVLSH